MLAPGLADELGKVWLLLSFDDYYILLDFHIVDIHTKFFMNLIAIV